MDLLASLGLADALPEQSTRLSHPGIVKCLNSKSTDDGNSSIDDGVRLGFNHCLHCGTNINDNLPNKPVTCKGCKRVKYCSSSCRKSDSQSCPEDEETGCVGHSPVVCSLLNLCNKDEDAEEELICSDHESSSSSSDGSKKEAARYRVQTERESYPATLFNLLAESPQWFTEAMTSRIRYMEDVRSPVKKQRRGKRDRSSLSPTKEEESGGKKKKELVLHIVGASVDSELWGWNGKKQNQRSNSEEEGDDFPEVLTAYAEASTNLLSLLKNLLEVRGCSIRLVFIGPDCPKIKGTTTFRAEVPIPDAKGSTLVVETYCCDYGCTKQPTIPPPDAVVFFNPGFSCTDYDWSKALGAASAKRGSGSAGTPYLITTNTEMEGFADVKCLLDGGYINSKSLPNDILEAVDYPTNDQDDSECTFFFGENPYSGLRVRQSGTMGNDLYVKNRWIFGGLFSQQGSAAATRTTLSSKKRKISAGKSNPGSDDDNDDEHASRKRQRGSKKSKNSKKKNPALI